VESKLNELDGGVIFSSSLFSIRHTFHTERSILRSLTKESSFGEKFQAKGNNREANMNLSHSLLALEDVVINSELPNRASKVPDYEAENRALMALAQSLADAPDTILQRLAETALQLCRADTAGISLLERQDGAEVFRWEALAGVFSDRLNATMPRDASPCGTTIDRNATQLMYMAERIFPALKSEPPIVETLLIPFHVGHKPIGTVWVVAHDERRKFDREDERIVKTLAQFAAASWQLWQARIGAEAAARNQQQHVLDLAAVNAALKGNIDSRMKVEEQLQQLNRELQTRISEKTAELTKANADLVKFIEDGKNFDKQLPQSEMTSRIGKLTAGVAHDFNNILNVIQAYAALIMSHPAEQQRVVEDAEVIRVTVEEGAALARQLLTAGRNTETKFELADINDLLQRTTRSLTPVFPATVGIAADLDPRMPLIMIDAGFIYQAILNVCINARDAMPDGGKIFLQTRTILGAALRQRFPEASAQQYVCISVADTGVGMEADVRSRGFESYFTTKTPDQGTGLGLSIVYDIVTEHAGFIEVASEPGCGSTFHIYLPIPAEEAAADDITPPAAHSEIEDRPRQRETILYAEDDARLSGLMQRLLEKEGFEVLTAQDGVEAVELHSRYKDQIGIALLDLRLAKLNGWDAFQRMKKINPKLKGILASGYVPPEVESRLAKGELNGVLQKPYFGEEVLSVIKQAIQSE
jgi:signal transduction histidine kinase/ActR/RegA family two-component response regulator